MGDQVRRVFETYPEHQRRPLRELRALIFDAAAEVDGAASLTETLAWGQPSYALAASRTGTAVRISPFGESDIAVLVNCQTTLIGDFRALFPDLRYLKNRAIVLPSQHPLPEEHVRLFVVGALTYRRAGGHATARTR